jgi:hypothetical protein
LGLINDDETGRPQPHCGRYKLVEEFSDFRAENGLTLPHGYNLQFSVFQLNNPLAFDWTINLEKFTFDYPIEAKEFVTDH